MESVENATGKDFQDEGQMMWARQAIKFWQSADGGALTEEEAELKWKTETADLNNRDIMADNLGPAKKPLRIRVHTADKVNFTNSYAKKRKVEMSERPNKKAMQEDSTNWPNAQ